MADNNVKREVSKGIIRRKMMGGGGMVERRKYMRFEVSVDVEYMVPGNGIPIEGISITKNLSREGMQLVLNKRLVPGEELEFKLRIPGDAAPIYAKGVVVWIDTTQAKDEPRAGVKFIQIGPFDRNRILEHIYKEWVEKKIKEKAEPSAEKVEPSATNKQ